MNAAEKKMVDLLVDLKENHHASAIKGNMESTGMQTWELMRLKEVVLRSGLKLTVKLGGAEAITDMREARAVGADRIAAPMTSCEFSLRKYVAAIDTIFPAEEKKGIDFIFYIETITAYNNLEAMLQAPKVGELSGLVIGREDLVWSMGMTGTDDDYNNAKVLQLTKDTLTKAKAKGFETTIGGGTTSERNLKTLKDLPPGLLDGFQTKMVRFKCPAAFDDKSAGLLKATEFEVLWLKNQCSYYEAVSKESLKTIEKLEARYKSLQ
ncbi:MAG: 2,4-dihydroxyhept-2-ene,7-dioic acid aldolase [Betaproteobacteria bacterium]|nr:2,4-dihydroxyhept-2-ene,7-dioic acid aldolase [Betaproteobacteria bacterium]